MCGIAGAVGVDLTPGALQAMSRAMYRRGPDDEGFYRADGIHLAFRRLAIVDLVGGRQPMANEDGRVRVVFNGEIYDHDRLRTSLERHGHRFATDHSDTEVLVHGWEEWREDMFVRLNGMFAVAIWDESRQSLTLARDRYGIKPLYYAPLPGGGLAFASEIKAIHASGLVDCQPSPEGIMEYFSFQNIWRSQTMFRGVHQLPPGCSLTWSDGRREQRQYWDITFPRSRRESLNDLADEHREILKGSLRRQIAADVPVTSYLSGGIDSTAISMGAFHQDPGLQTYSCIFNLDDVGTDRIVDEREFSRLVAETYGITRHELELSPDSMADCLADYVWSMEDLRMGMGYPVYLIAQRVAQDAKVVLSGTGGDEFHCGYVGRYQALGLLDGPAAPSPQSWLRRIRNALGMRRVPTVDGDKQVSIEAAYRRMLNFVVPQSQRDLAFTPEFLRQTSGYQPDDVMSDYLKRCPSADWRDRVMYVDAKTYLVGLLVFEDKVSMAHSIETRVPLLDNELIDFALELPFDKLAQGEQGKIVFRESVKPWVPESIYTKPKMGFGPPDASWYRGKLRSWIERMLGPLLADGRGVLRPEFVRTTLHEHFSGSANRTYLIWSLLNFEHWCRTFAFFGASAAAPPHQHVPASHIRLTTRHTASLSTDDTYGNTQHITLLE